MNFFLKFIGVSDKDQLAINREFEYLVLIFLYLKLNEIYFFLKILHLDYFVLSNNIGVN